jgi:hypothetical protein
MDLILKMKLAFAPPAAGPTQEVMELRNMVQTLAAKMESTLEKGGPIQAEIARFKAMRELGEMVNPPSEDKPSFLEYIPDITKGISDIAKAFATGRTPQVQTPRRPQEPQPRPAAPEAAPVQKVPVPAQQAILALRDAKADAENFDQEVVNSLFGLVSSLHSGGEPWTTKAAGILNRLKAANSHPEVQALLTDTLLACGAQKVIASAPGMIERCSVAIWRHYHEIYAAVWAGEPVKFLSDNPEGKFVTPGETVAAAPGKKPPKPAPAPAPGPSEPEPASGVEEVENEDEESEEEDDDDLCPAEDAEGDACLLEKGHEGDHDFGEEGDEEEDGEGEEG